jgi:hypothetical protein
MKTTKLVTIVMSQVTLPTSVLMRRDNTRPSMRGGAKKRLKPDPINERYKKNNRR